MSVLIKELEKLNTDEERWAFILKNKAKGLKVILDNDDTIVVDENYEFAFISLGDYIGCSDGVFTLLKVLGIDAEYC